MEDACDADPVRRTAPLGAEGGRGIELLDLLSQAWGGHRTATGKTTWFELSHRPRAETGVYLGTPRSGSQAQRTRSCGAASSVSCE